MGYSIGATFIYGSTVKVPDIGEKFKESFRNSPIGKKYNMIKLISS